MGGRLALLAALVLVACQANLPQPSTATPSSATGPPPAATATVAPAAPAVAIGRAILPVELRVSPEEQARGLSGRENLPPGTGMLFLFKEDAQHSFWMKDMRFPLDMVWINAACRVVDVAEHVPPPAPGTADSALPVYTSKAPARFVLEVNAGEAAASGIAIGEAAAFRGEALKEYPCAWPPAN